MKQSLNGKWYFRRVGDDMWYEGKVPGSVCADLIANDLLDDPYYRDNEQATLKALEEDYEYKRMFKVDEAMYACEKIKLVCQGIDTLAHIYLNDKHLKDVSDMHRIFEIDVKEYLVAGANTFYIRFDSPYKEALRKHSEDPIHTSVDSIYGFTQIRKAHYMYGWDWGPKIPDMGIWRDVALVGVNDIELKDVYITQQHEEDKVILDVKVDSKIENRQETYCKICVNLKDEKIAVVEEKVQNGVNRLSVTIDHPKKWWPNGYGEQPLYQVEVSLENGDEEIRKNLQIGLRTMELKREEDEWGESFEICVNGISLFAMGANYIPEDNLLNRCHKERTEKLLEQCVKANYNCIRIWGGGYYLDDYFYDACDRYGLVVWQDLLFACGKYKLTDQSVEDIIEETKDNMKRIRHHASLGLWCGNNEMEWAWDNWDNFKDNPRMKNDYVKLFEYILPEVAKAIDPATPYWLSSPSSGGCFVEPNDPNRGDVHYWDVWHKLKPFTAYRSFHFRFCSEFGFQSFPCMKTVESFTKPEDRNIFSYVMEQHQKNGSANGLILFYLSDNFKYPEKCEDLLYISQILQAEAIKYGVEHWRANRGRCMGALYWQLNDCWPVASWSSIDYFGRWKALHYYAKKFYAPILLSAIDEKDQVTFNVSNETLEEQKVTVEWTLRRNTGEIIEEDCYEAVVPKLTALHTKTVSFTQYLQEPKASFDLFLEYRLIVDGEERTCNTLLFTKAKYFNFLDPYIDYTVEEKEESFILRLTAENFAKYVELDSDAFDFVASDNYFDLVKGQERIIEVMKKDISKVIDLETFKKRIKVKSLYTTL